MGQTSTFAEHGLVAYQIEGNHKCSNLVANISPADPPPPHRILGIKRSKFKLFQNVVMLHNKLKKMEHRAPCKHVFSPYTLPQPVGWI